MNFWAYLNWLLVVISAGCYAMFLRRVFFTARADHGRDWFNAVDVVAALSFALLLGLTAVLSFSEPRAAFSLTTVKAGLVLDALVAAGIIAYLAIRKVPLGEFFNGGKMPLWKLTGLALLLILVCAPLVGWLANVMNPGGGDDQEIVTFFREHSGSTERLWMVLMAVVVAPFTEELVFRGFLYGVFQRYFGKLASMFFTSVLFAAIHVHLPTMLPLTVLALGFTLGLEMSGSLLVPMVMHAAFNGTTLLFLMNAPAP